MESCILGGKFQQFFYPRNSKISAFYSDYHNVGGRRLLKNSDTERKKLAFSSRWFQRFVKTIFYMSKEAFMEIFFLWKNNCYQVRKLSRKNITFCSNFYLQCWQSWVQRVQWNQLRKKFGNVFSQTCFYSDRKKVVLLHEFSRKDVKTSF